MEKFWKVAEKTGIIVGILSGIVAIFGWQFNLAGLVKLGRYGLAIYLILCVIILINFKLEIVELKMKKGWIIFLAIIGASLLAFSFYIPETSNVKAEDRADNVNSEKEITKETNEEIEKEIIEKVEELPEDWEAIKFTDDYFIKKITVEKSGSFKSTIRASNNDYLKYTISSVGSEEELVRESISSSDSSAPETKEIMADLSPGDYEIKIEKSSASYSESNSNEEKIEWKNEYIDFMESVLRPIDTIDQAFSIQDGDEIVSSFGLTDKVNFFKFKTNTSGTLNLIISAYMNTLRFEMLDKDGKQIENNSKSLYGGEVKNPVTEELRYDIEPGEYILKFEKENTGKYTIKSTFEMGANNEKNKNDDIVSAYPINLGEKKDLFMSMQDQIHYFKLNLTEPTKIEAIVSAEFNSLSFEILSSENLLTVEKKNVYLNGAPKDLKTEKLEFDLDKGTYIIKIGKESGTGKYSLIMN